MHNMLTTLKMELLKATPLLTLALSAALLLINVCFFYFLHLLSFSRKSNQSGGLARYPVLGCLISFHNNRHRLLDWYTELLAESLTQTIVVDRLGARRTIVTCNPENIKYILKTNFENYPKGRPFTDILGDLLGRGIFNVDGELWHHQRKFASREFAAKSFHEFLVRTLETEVNERLLPILESACMDGRVVDLQELLRRFTFDIVCKVSLGMDPTCLEPSLHVSAFLRAFDVASEISARRGAAPVFAVWKAKRALSIGSERRLKEAVAHIQDFIMELIRIKKAGNGRTKSNDLLSRLIISGSHNEETVRDMVISFIMAGRDTTSSALTWLLWLLSRHKQIEKEVAEEVMLKTSQGRERLDYKTLEEMSLLKACLCESMRLYPPVAWDSKHALGTDTLPDGTRVGEGDRVTYFPYGMGRMERVWGGDCMEFKPRRWLERKENVSAYKFPVFQGGPRMCLGKEMAFVEMKYVVASMLRRFEVRGVREEEPTFVPLLTAHMAGGLKVLVQERKSLRK